MTPERPSNSNIVIRLLILITALLAILYTANAQELQAKVNIKHNKISVSDISIFQNMQQSIEQLLNERQWTDLQFQENEHIDCSFNITIDKYDRANSVFECTAMIQANRPVFNSQYTSTLYNNKDADFNFHFAQFDQLNFNDENVDNQLTALIAYYAYWIIGLNLDSFSPLGGTEVMQRCLTLVNNAQHFEYTGWKAFDNSRNRFALINDYLDEAMKPFRMLQYDYYRKGLDEMAVNVERGRTNITTALQDDLQKAKDNKPLSMLPMIWTDYKRDELANIYKGKGAPKEKETVFSLLSGINAAQSNAWEKIKQ